MAFLCSLFLRFSLSDLVVLPMSVGFFDISVLTLLRPATEQYHKLNSVTCEIDTVPGPEADFQFVDSLSYCVYVRCIARFEPRQSRNNLGSRDGIEAAKPDPEWRSAMCLAPYDWQRLLGS